MSGTSIKESRLKTYPFAARSCDYEKGRNMLETHSNRMETLRSFVEYDGNRMTHFSYRCVNTNAIITCVYIGATQNMPPTVETNIS